MRVLMCVPAFTPALDYGGPVTTIRLLATSLGEQGVDVEILAANFGRGRVRIESGRRVIDGTTVTYLPRLVSRDWLSISRHVGAAVRTSHPAVVHAFGLRDGLVTAAAFAALRTSVPLVVEPMGMAVPRMRNIGIKTQFDRLARRVLERAAATIATSDVELTELQSLGYPNLVLRPNPIEFFGSNTRPPAEFDICYIGRLHAKKRLTDIVAALRANRGWNAIIVGPDDDGTKSVLVAKAAQAGVAERLTFRDWVDEEQRTELLEKSRCFVLPSSTENFGNSAAEAIAVGTPAVVTDKCGVAALVQETGLGRVVPVDTNAVIEAIQEILNDTRRSTEGDPLRTTYNATAVGALQLGIYEQVISCAQ